MKSLIFGIVTLGSLSASARGAIFDPCSVKVLLDKGFQVGPVLANTDGSGEGRAAKFAARNEEKIMKELDKSLSKSNFNLAQNQENTSYSLHVDSRRTYKCHYGACDYFTVVALQLINSNGQTIETVSANSKASTQADSRYRFKGYTFKKHMDALEKALSKIETNCPPRF